MRNTMKGHLLLCFMCFSLSLFSNTIYINYDGSCIDRYEYLSEGDDETARIAYHVKVKDWEHLVLNVDVEKIFRYSKKPGNIKTCQEIFNCEEMVKNINNGKTQVFIIKKDSYGFYVNQVSSAAYLFSTNYEIGYTDTEFSFAYNLSEPVSGNDLALRDSKSAVFFEGNITFKCPKKYLFSIENKDNLTEYTFVPKVGIVTVEPEPNPPFIQAPKMSLKSINGKDLDTYLNTYCQNNPVLANETKAHQKPTTTSTASNNLEVLESGKVVYTNQNYPTVCSHIYKDVDRGLFIDRNTGLPANGSCGGNSYNSGFRVTNSSPPNTGTITNNSTHTTHSAQPSYTIYKNLDTGLFMDRTTGLPADGYFGGQTYANGIWLNNPDRDLLASRGNTVVNTQPAVVKTQPAVITQPTNIHRDLTCGIYKDIDKNLYIDRSTGGLANITCGGNTFHNGYLVNQTNTTTAATTHTAPMHQPSVVTTARSVSPCNVTPGPGEHVVLPKETLYGIARLYGVSVKQIRAWNKMGSKTTKIHPCSALKVYAPMAAKGPAPSPCAPSGTYGVHIVQPKETLFGIAKSNGITLNQLKAWNGLRNNTIHPCMELLTNGPAQANKVVAIPNSYDQLSAKGRINPYEIPANGYYIVKGNETLYSISKRFGISIATIKQLNGLTSDKINLNQRLLLKAPITTTSQTLPKGMPKAVPAERPAHLSTPTTAVPANVPTEYGVYQMTSRGAVPAQRESIKSQIIQPFVTKGDEEGRIITGRRMYKVRQNDTIDKIARYFDLTVQELRALNNLETYEIIIPGQDLFLD